MPFCFWSCLRKNSSQNSSEFEPMNEDLTEFNENVRFSSYFPFEFYRKAR